MVTASHRERLVAAGQLRPACTRVKACGDVKENKKKKKRGKKTEDMESPAGVGEETNLKKKENFLKGKKKFDDNDHRKKTKRKNQMINIKARIRRLQLRNFVIRTNQDSKFLFKKKKKVNTKRCCRLRDFVTVDVLNGSQSAERSVVPTNSLSLSLYKILNELNNNDVDGIVSLSLSLVICFKNSFFLFIKKGKIQFNIYPVRLDISSVDC